MNQFQLGPNDHDWSWETRWTIFNLTYELLRTSNRSLILIVWAHDLFFPSFSRWKECSHIMAPHICHLISIVSCPGVTSFAKSSSSFSKFYLLSTIFSRQPFASFKVYIDICAHIVEATTVATICGDLFFKHYFSCLVVWSLNVNEVRRVPKFDTKYLGRNNT